MAYDCISQGGFVLSPNLAHWSLLSPGPLEPFLHKVGFLPSKEPHPRAYLVHLVSPEPLTSLIYGVLRTLCKTLIWPKLHSSPTGVNHSAQGRGGKELSYTAVCAQRKPGAVLLSVSQSPPGVEGGPSWEVMGVIGSWRHWWYYFAQVGFGSSCSERLLGAGGFAFLSNKQGHAAVFTFKCKHSRE